MGRWLRQKQFRPILAQGKHVLHMNALAFAQNLLVACSNMHEKVLRLFITFGPGIKGVCELNVDG